MPTRSAEKTNPTLETKLISKRRTLNASDIATAATSGIIAGTITARLTDVSLGIGVGIFIAGAILVEARHQH